MAKDRCLPMKIANEFEMQGVPSPSGEPWSARAVRYILKNIKYAGWGFRGKEPESRLPGPKDDTPMTICENAHQAAVDYKDWLEIQEQIEGRQPGNAPPRSHGSESLLSSVAKCGECKTEKRPTASPRAAHASGVRTRKIQGNPRAPIARTSTWSSWRRSSSTGPETSSSPKRRWRAHSKLPKAAAMRTSQNRTAANQVSRQRREPLRTKSAISRIQQWKARKPENPGPSSRAS